MKLDLQNKFHSLDLDNVREKLYKELEEINTKKSRQIYYNYKEDENNIYFVFELPGVTLDNLDIQLSKINKKYDYFSLDIDAKRFDDINNEISYYRSLTIHRNIDEDNISAHLENGILTIIIPFFNKDTSSRKKITPT